MTKRLRPQMLDAPRSLLPSSLHVRKSVEKLGGKLRLEGGGGGGGR